MHSRLYEGQVTHRRFSPVKHQFGYRLFMVYLDLAELPELLTRRGLISGRRFSRASFVQRDHLKDHSGALDEATRELVEDRTGTCVTAKRDFANDKSACLSFC